MTLTYGYALAREFPGDAPPDLTGIDAQPVRFIADRGVLAVVSDVPEQEFAEEPLRAKLQDLRWLADVAHAHDAVVRAVDETTVTAPLRLATVFRDDDALRTRLASWHDAACRTLDELAGRHEWGVKGYLEPAKAATSAPVATIAPQPAAAAAERPGHLYLEHRRSQQRRSALAQQAATRQVTELCETLGQIAVSAKKNALQDPRLSRRSGTMLLNASFLVDAARTAEFRRAVDEAAARAAEHCGLSVELTGPWPPYSFARLDV